MVGFSEIDKICIEKVLNFAQSVTYAMDSNTGKYIIFVGLGVVVIGLLIYFFHDKLHWFGRLPGDIRVERENFRFYFPITTMILLSVVLTILINLIKKFL